MKQVENCMSHDFCGKVIGLHCNGNSASCQSVPFCCWTYAHLIF